MKVQSLTNRFMLLLVCFAMLFAISLLAGCSGDDGAAGAAGAAGPAGPAGPVTTTGESGNVCHSTGQIAAITTYHPDKVATVYKVSGIQVSTAAGFPTISFHVDKDTNGTLVSDATLTYSQARFYIADLVPAGAVTAPTGTHVPNLEGTLATPYFEQWGYDNGKVFTNNGSGDYTYTFSTLWGAPTNTWFNVADIDVTPDTGHTQRLVLRVAAPSGVTTVAGTAATQDFKVPAEGATATPLTDQRLLTTIDTCQKCHSTTMLAAAHGGGGNGYVDTKACVICHSPLYATTNEPAGFMAELQADFPNFIHKIHAAMPMAEWPTRLNGRGYGAVTYPQEIQKCDVCHTGAGDLGTNFKTHPTRRACGSCHDTLVFASGAAYTGIKGTAKAAHPVMTTDAACSGCHSATGAAAATDIVTAHDTAIVAGSARDPEFGVNLSLSAPAGAFYAAGETVDVTVTLTTNTTGNPPVSSSVYTTPKAAAGTTGGGLSTASLYIYGPRSKALPLLGTQAISLFTGGTDTRVTTDATGFKYRFVIPANVTAGTYMVRFRAGDYGRVNDTNYKVESIAFKNDFQIGTATVQTKIDGNACVDCHGIGSAPFHDARHIVVFDTDECVSCHDLSGGHAAPIANRVHAVHSASPGGSDLVSGRVWSDVTYPQGTVPGPTTNTLPSVGAKVCVGCHTSGNTAYKTNALGAACYGCHGDNTAAVDHMLQQGGPVKQ